MAGHGPPPPRSLASLSRPRSSFSSWVSFSHLRPPIRWVYGAAVISGRRAVPYFGLVFRVRPWLGGRPGSRGWARPLFPLSATKGWPPFAKSVVQLLEPPGGWSQTFVRTLVVVTWTVNVSHGLPWPAVVGQGRPMDGHGWPWPTMATHGHLWLTEEVQSQ